MTTKEVGKVVIWLIIAIAVFGLGYLTTHIVVTSAMKDYKEPLTVQELATVKLGDIVTEDTVWRLQPTEPVQETITPEQLNKENKL